MGVVMGCLLIGCSRWNPPPESDTPPDIYQGDISLEETVYRSDGTAPKAEPLPPAIEGEAKAENLPYYGEPVQIELL